MDFKNIIISFAVVFIGFFGMFALLNSFNADYGTDAGATFNSTAQQVKIYQNITGLSSDAGSNMNTQEASGQDTASIGSLIKQGLSTIKLLPRLSGMAESLFFDIGVGVLKIPSEIVIIGYAVFLFVFALTIAYILLIGAKRLIPG